MTGPDTVMYRATVEDPTVFSAPWTIEVPLNRLDNQENKIYEAACHEGKLRDDQHSGWRASERPVACRDAKRPGKCTLYGP